MTSTRKARPASRWMGLLGAALAVAPGLARATAPDLYYERTVMIAADERCGLFAPAIAGALQAAAAQARGAALRAGSSADSLDLIARRAQGRADAVDCASPALTQAAQQVRLAFAGLARVQRVDYPGDVAGWRAERGGAGEIHWRLAQETRFGPDRMMFGLAGRAAPGLPIAVAEFADGAEPYAARLLLRDPARAGQPYLDRRGAAQVLPLPRRIPPTPALKAYAAEARSTAGADLLPKDARGGWAFRFPAAAAPALAALDPREAVAVEFLFKGDVVRRAYVEVGDFAAGRAFLTLTER